MMPTPLNKSLVVDVMDVMDEKIVIFFSSSSFPNRRAVHSLFKQL